MNTWTSIDDEEVPGEVVLSAHRRPRYPEDPGDGIDIHKDGDTIFFAVTWDGACRDVWRVPRQDLLKVLARP